MLRITGAIMRLAIVLTPRGGHAMSALQLSCGSGMASPKRVEDRDMSLVPGCGFISPASVFLDLTADFLHFTADFLNLAATQTQRREETSTTKTRDYNMSLMLNR